MENNNLGAAADKGDRITLGLNGLHHGIIPLSGANLGEGLAYGQRGVLGQWLVYQRSDHDQNSPDSLGGAGGQVCHILAG